MSAFLPVHRNRTNTVLVDVGIDVSGETLTSEIRVDQSPTSLLLATWQVSFLTDGTDGELVLVLDDSATSGITHSNGYMDIKRMSGGEPLAVFDEPLEVKFRGTVTA